MKKDIRKKNTDMSSAKWCKKHYRRKFKGFNKKLIFVELAGP